MFIKKTFILNETMHMQFYWALLNFQGPRGARGARGPTGKLGPKVQLFYSCC